MTTLAMHAIPSGSDDEREVQPIAWRRMGWVTWRQHRAALVGVGVLFAAVIAGLTVAGLQLHHVYSLAIACHPASSFACNNAVNAFNGMYGFLSNGFIFQALPALIGAFVGAPLLARELETGTFRFAWTQGIGRWRWTLAKLVVLGVSVTAASGAITLLFSWYYQPYFPAARQALYVSKEMPIAASSPFFPGLFDLRGVSYAAWTLAAFAIGVLAGVVIRRVVPAIVATLAGYTGLAFAAGAFLRQHYLAPLVTNRVNLPSSAWIISQNWFTNRGQLANDKVINVVLQQAAPQQVTGKGGVPKSIDVNQYLIGHGFHLVTTYQPGSRFWPFQWIEAGALVGLSALLFAITTYAIRRRVT